MIQSLVIYGLLPFIIIVLTYSVLFVEETSVPPPHPAGLDFADLALIPN